MKIRIDKTNGKKIVAAINAAEGKSTARCLETYRLFDAAEAAEKKLDDLGIPKKARIGCGISVQPEVVSNSYGYGAQGTWASITRYPTGWFLTSVKRSYCRTKAYGDSERSRLDLSELAQNAIPDSYFL